ncbi:MAG: ParB N-terminal domain-containing protein [Pseudomonadota bacterium]
MARVIADGKQIPLDQIKVGERERPVNDAGVEAIMSSVQTIGRFLDAIQIRKVGKRYELIVGNHRLEAARRLGEKTIRATVWECSADEAKLFEIDDNLARAELSALEMCTFLARRKEVFLRLNPETAQGSAGAKARWQNASDIDVTCIEADAENLTDIDVHLIEPTDCFAEVVAQKRGVSKRHAHRLVAIGESLQPKTIEILHASSLPVTLKDLTEIAKLHGEEQIGVADALVHGPATKVIEAERLYRQMPAPLPEAPEDVALRKLTDIFNRAPMVAKRRFLEILWSRHGDLMDQEADSRQ